MVQYLIINNNLGKGMNIEQFKTEMKNRTVVVANSELHLHMFETGEMTRKITAEINNQYNPPEKIQELFSQLIGQKVVNFTLFPPFYTDYGKNISVGGKRVYKLRLLFSRPRRH